MRFAFEGGYPWRLESADADDVDLRNGRIAMKKWDI